MVSFEFFIFCGSVFDSASIRNKYQEDVLGGKAAGA